MKLTGAIIVLFLLMGHVFSQDIWVDSLDLKAYDTLGYRNYTFPELLNTKKCKNILKTGDLDLEENNGVYGGNYDYYNYLYDDFGVRYDFPNDQNEEKDKFYFIGMSEDGKVAYTILPQSFSSDHFFVQTVIQDIHTQKILWHHHIRYDVPEFDYLSYTEVPNEKDSLSSYEPYNLGRYWVKYYNEIAAKLYEHKIIQKPKQKRKRYTVYNDIKYAKGRWENDEVFVDMVVHFKGDTSTIEWRPKNENLLGVQFAGYLPNDLKEDEGIAIFLEVYPLEKELIPENEEQDDELALHTYKKIRFMPISTQFEIGINPHKITPGKQYAHNSRLTQYEGFRKIWLTEIISDQIGMNEEDWVGKYGGPYIDFHHLTEEYKYVYEDYRNNNKIAPEFTLEDRTYFLAQTRGRSYSDTRTYILGNKKSDSSYISERYYVLHYEKDSGDFSYFLDFSEMKAWNNSQINYLLYNSDSIIYIMLANDQNPDKNGDFIIAYDYKNHQTLWRSENSTANSLSMCYNKDVLFCGYSDGKKHYLNLINRLNGKVLQSIEIEFPAKWLVLEGGFLEVFAGRSNYEFKMNASFFNGYE